MRAAAGFAIGALLLAAATEGGGPNGESWQAFVDVAAVLTHPRCLNCHVPGDSPLQGDAGIPHNMNVRRGADGRGTPAARCTNCHQEASSTALHAPPGAPDWRLPPPNMRMAWQGLTTEQICRSLKDPRRNGGRNLGNLVEHVTSDRLVNAAWSPGPGRAAPPISHEEFVRRFVRWVDGGAPCAPVETSSRSTQ
ncbi:MAG TPA: Isoquinoline 1-oxidoreductase subunit [Myxococcales bacterium]|nr:Isoquinoline 1-oxidoreductase subunit [Myxococcales bacterium]